MALKEEIKVIIDTGLNGEFDEILKETETKNYKEIYNGKVTLFIEFYEDVAYIKSDIKAIYRKVNKIMKVYSEVSYPYQAIEILKNEKIGAEIMAKKKEEKTCKTCVLNKNGCIILNERGYRKGSCGAWTKRKE